MEEDDIELIRKYRETGDINLRNQIVEQYMYLADILAKKFSRRGVEYDDLYQIASEAIIQSVEKFDPDQDARLSTYITSRASGIIKNYFRDYSKTIRLPRKLYGIYARVKHYMDTYSKENEKKPTVSQISEATGIPKEIVMQVMEYKPPISLDSPVIAVGEETDTSTYDTVVGDDSTFDKLDEKVSIQEELKKLDPREQTLVRMRFMEGKSQAETGKALGVSQMFVSRLENKVKEKLAAALR